MGHLVGNNRGSNYFGAGARLREIRAAIAIQHRSQRGRDLQFMKAKLSAIRPTVEFDMTGRTRLQFSQRDTRFPFGGRRRCASGSGGQA
jgi:hypothetical protein